MPDTLHEPYYPYSRPSDYFYTGVGQDSALLLRTMELIEAEPERHEQRFYFTACGARLCYAGHAAVLGGARLPTEDLDRGYGWGIDQETGDAVDLSEFSLGQEGDVLGIHEHAARVLGLSSHNANMLFMGDNTVATLRAMVDALVDSPGRLLRRQEQDGTWDSTEPWVLIEGEMPFPEDMVRRFQVAIRELAVGKRFSVDGYLHTIVGHLALSVDDPRNPDGDSFALLLSQLGNVRLSPVEHVLTFDEAYALAENAE